MPDETRIIKDIVANDKGSISKSLAPATVERDLPANLKGTNFSVEQLPELGGLEEAPTNQSSTSTTEQKPVSKETPKEVKTEEPSGEVTEELKKEAATEDIVKNKVSTALKQPKKEKKEGEVEEEVSSEKPITKIVPKPKDNTAFDYTGYSNEEQVALKNMSPQSRQLFAKLKKENTELSKLKDSTYLQHEEAYVLNPEYKQLQVNSILVGSEYEHWKAQLQKCKKGEDITDLKGFDDRGNPVYGAVMKPSDELEEQIRVCMQNSLQTKNDFNKKLQEFPKQFKDVVTRDNGIIDSISKQLFGWVEDPSLMKCEVLTEQGDQSLEKIGNDFLNQMPIYHRKHPMTGVAKNLIIALAIVKAELNELKGASKVTETKLEEVKRAEPSSKARVSKEPATVNGVRNFDVNGSGIEF
jgi:hypothetical protein